jgi:hypothetical protein
MLSLLFAAGAGMIFGISGGFSNPVGRTTVTRSLIGKLAKFAVEVLLCLRAGGTAGSGSSQ